MVTPDLPNRHTIRLPGFDYSQPGAYFVTIVTHKREPLLAHMEVQHRCTPTTETGTITLTDIGRIAQEEWFKTSILRPYVRLEPDEFVVMPNHIHGIIWIVDEWVGDPLIGAQRRCAPTAIDPPSGVTQFPGVPPCSLAAIVRGYKSAISYRANALRQTRGAPLWQRNYYEHIIRDPGSLEKIRDYIRYNPLRWEDDRENPDHHPNEITP